MTEWMRYIRTGILIGMGFTVILNIIEEFDKGATQFQRIECLLTGITVALLLILVNVWKPKP